LYTWDFGDGTTTVSTENPIAKHVFASEGTFTVNLLVSDDFGFQDSISQTVSVTLDSQAPVTIDNYDGTTHTSAFTITLTATDDLSGVAEIYYKINDGPTQTVTANGQPLINSEGINKLEYWSEDNAGNQETPHKTINNIILGSSQQTTSPTSTQPTPTSTSENTLPLYEQTVFWVIIGIVLAVAVSVLFLFRKTGTKKAAIHLIRAILGKKHVKAAKILHRNQRF
jgi:PKD repeat protein